MLKWVNLGCYSLKAKYNEVEDLENGCIKELFEFCSKIRKTILIMPQKSLFIKVYVI